MRTIVARLCMSEDGIVDQPERWLRQPAHGTVIDQLVTGSETVLLGRKTFEQYAATGLEHSRTLVVSSQPVSARPDTEVLQGDPRRVLAALKRVPGSDLHVVGSLTLMRSLLRWRLIDEVALRIHPVAAGRGAFLDRRSLRLISMWAGDSGVLEARYRMLYAETASSSRPADSAGRWGGTRIRDRVASSPRTAIRTHA